MSRNIEDRICDALRLGLLGRGLPLEAMSRLRMERMLGRTLPEVRIHDTEQAATLAHLVGARAFTVGAHIFAPPQRFNLDTGEGAGLLAHELTHVSQQTRSLPDHTGATSTPSPGSGLPAGRRGLSGAAEPQEAAGRPGVRLPKLEAASGDTAVGATGGEREARAMERAARTGGAGEDRGERGRRPDPEELAERVYQLMQEELWLYRERAAFL